jgi:hypothetical protein
MKAPRAPKLPRTLPGNIEIEPDRYAASLEATVAQWRAAKAFPRPDHQGTISKIVDLADRFNIPDDVPLLPRLLALAQNTPLLR